MRWWAALLSFAVACASHGPSSHPVVNKPYAKAPIPESASERTRACFENPATQAYLKEFHHRIIEHWNVPYGTAYDVAAKVTLDASGAVTAFRVGEDANTAQSDAIIEAVKAAKPFPALTGEATCLSRVPILMRFRTAIQK